MKGMFFVLDYDETYAINENKDDNEEEYGVTPTVYYILENDVEKVKAAANESKGIFCNDISCCLCLGDIFEELLSEMEIFFTKVGSLKIPYRERQDCYLSGGIETVYI